ncbi:hypothetical protein EVAR_43016_1 [Eumeta japonica]|uniref:Protein kinase domain-containing protein n=1 Tax=Eumeta variegata TaxID=151549 RepID=A0A4C1XLL0_EUMVA|nr:hypothetical protein EVAR_43016_1 [Eumeta japonica]
MRNAKTYKFLGDQTGPINRRPEETLHITNGRPSRVHSTLAYSSHPEGAMQTKQTVAPAADDVRARTEVIDPQIEPPFPYRDVTIKRNTDVKEYYEMLSEIGRGKFGTVYLCQEKNTGLQLAAKVVPVSRRDERRNVEREVEVMRALRHPRLIQLYDAYDWGKHMCVVLELVTSRQSIRGEVGMAVVSNAISFREPDRKRGDGASCDSAAAVTVNLGDARAAAPGHYAN